MLLYLILPAIGGPTVRGTEQRPRRKPIAWVAPFWPQISNAIGPRRLIKQPSKSPINSAITIRSSKLFVTVSSIVNTPIETNDI